MEYSIKRDVSYGPSPMHDFDIYVPNQVQNSKPIALYIHGGGWQRGNNKRVTIYSVMSRERQLLSLKKGAKLHYFTSCR